MVGAMYVEDKLSTFIIPVPGSPNYRLNPDRDNDDLAMTIHTAIEFIRRTRSNAEDLENERKTKYEVMKAENQKMGSRSLALEIEMQKLKKELADVKNAKSVIQELCMKKDGQLDAYRECFGRLLEAQDRFYSES